LNFHDFLDELLGRIGHGHDLDHDLEIHHDHESLKNTINSFETIFGWRWMLTKWWTHWTWKRTHRTSYHWTTTTAKDTWSTTWKIVLISKTATEWWSSTT
jgi:hypothetical protein